MHDANNEDVLAAIRSFGASDAAVAPLDDGPGGLPFAVSVAVRLSDAIIDEIGSAPTYTYFNHYRSVNYLIDQIMLRTGLWLQERGAAYITVAASQSRPDSPFEGRYSHKKAAVHAGLGTIGVNGLFLHREWGPRVRLGTVFTDWTGCAAFASSASLASDASACVALSCAACSLCVQACPAGAIGVVGTDRLASFDAARCSAWMKKAYQNIGRGAVCGICIAVCPAHDNLALNSILNSTLL